jgi:hypothetical protein
VAGAKSTKQFSAIREVLLLSLSLLSPPYFQEEISAAIKSKAQARSRARAAKKSDDARQGSNPTIRAFSLNLIHETNFINFRTLQCSTIRNLKVFNKKKISFTLYER